MCHFAYSATSYCQLYFEFVTAATFVLTPSSTLASLSLNRRDLRNCLMVYFFGLLVVIVVKLATAIVIVVVVVHYLFQRNPCRMDRMISLQIVRLVLATLARSNYSN